MHTPLTVTHVLGFGTFISLTFFTVSKSPQFITLMSLKQEGYQFHSHISMHIGVA